MQNHVLQLIQEDGFCIIENFINETLINSLCYKISLLESAEVKISNQILYTHSRLPDNTPHMDHIMRQWLNPCKKSGPFCTKQEIEKLRECIKQGCGNHILFQEILFSKQPGQRIFHWHQDYPFFPVDKPDGFTCWIALDNISKENGGLMFAKGSHHEIYPSVDLHTGYAQDNSGFTFKPKKKDIVILSLKKGDAVFFHPLIFHSSGPNQTASSRRAWGTVWFRKDVKWMKSNTPNHPRCKTVEDGALISSLL